MKLSKSPESIPRTNLVDMIMGRVQDWIIKGEIKPGEKLPSEHEMSLYFKVSKSVVREAISKLNALHRIDTYQGKGSFVSQESLKVLMPMDVQTGEDEFSNYLWELRQIFEPQIAQLAAQRRTDADLQKLRGLIEELDVSIQRSEMGYREDDLLHFTLAQTTHNPMLEKVAINIARMSEPFKRLSLSKPFRPNETRKEWQIIIQAVELQNVQTAWQSMYQHIKNSMDNSCDSDFKSNMIDHISDMEGKI